MAFAQTVHHVPKCMSCHKAIVFMITYILCSSCFCEIWALCVSWITYDHLYTYILYTYLFPLSFSYFIILLASKYLLMFSDFDALRSRCYFAFRLQMFPLRISERSNFLSGKIVLKSLLLLIQVFWLCPYSVLRQPWWMNLSWLWPCTVSQIQLTISNQF